MKSVIVTSAVGLFIALLMAGCCSSHRTIVVPNRMFRPAVRQGHAEGQRPPQVTVKAVLEEANESFSYRGVQIHPKLVKEFECWISDLNPVTIAVDVAAAFDSNEYCEDTYKNGKYFATRIDDGKAECGYKRIRTTRDGVHVLHTYESGQGTGVFRSEIWVRFEIGRGYDAKDKKCDQLLMRLVRARGLPSDRQHH